MVWVISPYHTVTPLSPPRTSRMGKADKGGYTIFEIMKRNSWGLGSYPFVRDLG